MSASSASRMITARNLFTPTGPMGTIATASTHVRPDRCEVSMGLLRGRNAEEHLKFQMREKMISVGDDYWIENDSGEKVFKVDGKALRVRDTWKLEDASGRTVAEIQEKKLSIRDKIEIQIDGGRT